MAKKNRFTAFSMVVFLLLFGYLTLTSKSPTLPKPAPNAAVPPNQAQASGILKVHYLDVGQADSILIQGPGGQNVLIDGGNNSDGVRVVEYLKKVNVTKLDAVVATHPHEDHIGGLDTVIKAFPVDSVYLPNKTSTTRTFSDLLAAIQTSGAKKIQAKLGTKLDIPGLDGVFMAPLRDNYDNLNNFSAVLLLRHGGNSFLFMGDAEREVEGEMLLQSQVQISATVLKVGHHGSDSSTSQEFLNLIKPAYAVISVGRDNDYGHPHQETLKKLKDAGVTVFRTDQAGTIVVTSNGESLKFN